MEAVQTQIEESAKMFLEHLFKASPARFGKMLISELRKQDDRREWEFDSQNFKIYEVAQGVNKCSTFINLHNIYADYCSVPRRERANQIKKCALAFFQHDIPTIFADARANLLPLVRNVSERGLTQLLQEDIKKGNGIAFRPFCGNLEKGIAYDSEQSIVRVTESNLRDWGVTFDQAFEIALDNLRAKSNKPFRTITPNLFVSNFGDYYDASRLFLTDLLHRQTISGDPVVMIPNRTTLFLTGDRNESELALMVQYAEKVLEQPRSLSPLMLKFTHGTWSSFKPSAHTEQLNLLRVRDEMVDYENQQQELNAKLEKSGIDMFVATYSGVKEDITGKVYSYCVWSEGVHSLLPKTDTVMLRRGDSDDILKVDWDVLADTCKHLLIPTGYVPHRFEVSAFPTADEQQALTDRMVAVDNTDLIKH